MRDQGRRHSLSYIFVLFVGIYLHLLSDLQPQIEATSLKSI